jgi:uncharacterized protein (DUF2147 family)
MTDQNKIKLPKMKTIYTILAFCFLQASLQSQNEVFGKWQTVDEKTGNITSVVEIFEKNKKLYGKVLKVIPAAGEESDPICTKCSDFRKDKKINGMLIVSGLTLEDGKWSDGKILDPDNGKEYECKIWFEDGKLKVRGYIAFVYRTQVWLPYKENN